MIMAIESDLGCGRNMDAYYKHLIDSNSILPIMIYTNAQSYNNSPKWIKNKYLFNMPFLTHYLGHCSPEYCTLKPSEHITHSQWQRAFIPYVLFLKNIYGNRAIWLIDMPMPIIETYMRKNIVQVFHSELFEIGPAPYFHADNIPSFSKYARIFVTGSLLKDEVIKRTPLHANDKRIRIIGRVLNDTLYTNTLDKHKILQEYNLDPSRRTIVYAPSWESQKIWGIGKKRDDIRNLERFCSYAKQMNFNVIIRPHPICIYQYQIKDPIIKTLKKYANTYFDDSTRSNYLGPNKTLIAADILVTDLSTIAGDFLSLGKPAIFLYPDKSQGIWGEYFPTIHEVQKISYTARGFSELFRIITNIETSGESVIEKKKRHDIVSYIFDRTDGTAGKTFKTEMDILAAELKAFDATFLGKLYSFMCNKNRPYHSSDLYFSAQIIED